MKGILCKEICLVPALKWGRQRKEQNRRAEHEPPVETARNRDLTAKLHASIFYQQLEGAQNK